MSARRSGGFSRRALCRAVPWTAAVLAFGSATGNAQPVPAQVRTPPRRDWLFGPLRGGSPGAGRPGQLFVHSRPSARGGGTLLENWNPASWERTWLYRRHFPHAPAGMRHFLEFGGAMTAATAVLNGHRLPPHEGGYLPFRHEITGLLAERNALDVVVDGPFDPEVPPNRNAPGSSVDFWQPAGLHREGDLVSVPGEHVADVFAKPADVLDPARRRVVRRHRQGPPARPPPAARHRRRSRPGRAGRTAPQRAEAQTAAGGQDCCPGATRPVS